MFGFALDMVNVWSQEQLDQLRSLPKMERRNIPRKITQIFTRGYTGYISSFSATLPLTPRLKVVPVVHPSPSPPANSSIALYVGPNSFPSFFSPDFLEFSDTTQSSS